MEVIETEIPDVKVIKPAKFGDHRGFFSETWNRKALAEAGIDISMVQDNHSMSGETGTVRGLHYQSPPTAQDKLLRVVSGAIYDVAVDIRKGSSTFGKYVGVEISAEAWNQLFIPIGFAHGFCTLAKDTEVLYKTSDYWSPSDEGGLRWNDPDLAIDWPVAENDAIVLERDANLPFLKDAIADLPF